MTTDKCDARHIPQSPDQQVKIWLNHFNIELYKVLSFQNTIAKVSLIMILLISI